jgi:sterol 24-C-methyltransferase
MKDAGFTIVCESDLATVKHVEPWMTPLMPSWNVFSQRFQFNCVGAVVTNTMIRVMEFLRLAPAGTVQTQKILQAGGFALRDAGQEGIFTTMYMMVGRKPLNG